ncbi:MAG: KH domain-containing protein [Candidatus Spechtbacteria bacterium]|nr:KH domain-containing protein [Candidatus Spechtbacteria bacterium]
METDELVKKEAHTLLSHMGYVCVAPTEVKERENRVSISLSIERPHELIGERGATLNALQHIIRLCVVKKYNIHIPIDIDINNYKKKREEFLQEFAKQIGERVRMTKNEMELEPMSPFDRRVIHCTLAEYSDLITESKGENESRHIVVRFFS